jgi:proteasome lid subunit RPN8/RPN11
VADIERATAVHPFAKRLVQGDLLGPIYRAVEAAYPEEGCGFVIEAADGALEVVPTTNRATQLHRMDPEAYPRDGRTYFEPDMKPWLRAVREGRTPRLIFHSHPDTGAYFSPTDRASAIVEGDGGAVLERHPGVVHLVVSVRGPMPAARVARLFEFAPEEAGFREVAAFDGAGRLLPPE